MVALALWVAGCGAAPPAPSSTAHESLAEPSPAEPAPAEPVAFAAAVEPVRLNDRTSSRRPFITVSVAPREKELTKTGARGMTISHTPLAAR